MIRRNTFTLPWQQEVTINKQINIHNYEFRCEMPHCLTTKMSTYHQSQGFETGSINWGAMIGHSSWSLNWRWFRMIQINKSDNSLTAVSAAWPGHILR